MLIECSFLTTEVCLGCCALRGNMLKQTSSARAFGQVHDLIVSGSKAHNNRSSSYNCSKKD